METMENNTNKIIIMNYLPPALTDSPSAAFSVLKGFLTQHGYQSKIINWNIIIRDLMRSHLPLSSISPDDYDILLMIPFLMDIAGKHNDPAAMQRVLSRFYSMYPKYTANHTAPGGEALEQLRDIIFQAIDSEWAKMDSGKILLFAFSAKFHQWIPGMVMAERLKKRFPGIKIVIGGFGGQKDASALMSICPHFDFASWGEGEYPLLELVRQLQNGEENNCLESIPHMVYRENQEIKITTAQSRYVDFDKYTYPDFTDFIEAAGDSARGSRITLETSRGCHWNRCKFCYLTVGYRYRRRTPESIVREVEHMSSRYNINRFLVVDSDFAGTDAGQFETLLDMLIESSREHRTIYDFQAEIVHYGFNARIMEKMALAGFNRVQIGYEAITDGLLKKVDKKTDFSDLILFVKFAAKFGIATIGSNIIRGIIGETPGDVMESIENLPFLRFFLNNRPGKSNLWHLLIKLRLEPGSRFFRMAGDEEKKEWNYHPAAYLLPDSFIDSEKRSRLFGFYGKLENEIEWSQFEKVNTFYQETDFRYHLNEFKGARYYSEYMNGELINYIVFNEPEYWEVLKAANDEVTSFENVFGQLREKFPGLTEERLREIIQALKADYLIYAGKDLTRMVSIIDAF
jgi:radical SAM superfamily enzyme YgiQ (UPF0313 family)